MFRKLLAGATAVVATAALSIIGLATPATAAGSDAPVPYTVTATSLTLPAGQTFDANSPIHSGVVEYIPLSQYRVGQTHQQPGSDWTPQHIGFQVDRNIGTAMNGSSTMPFSPTASGGAFSSALPSDGYCITWVQVDGFDEHFGEGGQAPICSGIADAAATVSTTHGSCAAAGSLDLGATIHASWGAPDTTTSPGHYAVTATAAPGHLFSNGSAYQTFTGDLDPKTTAGCGPQLVTIRSAPGYTPATCSAAGTLVVPAQDHIVWSGGADGAGPGRYTVTASIARADAGAYTLGSQQTTWTVVVSKAGRNQDGTAMSCVRTTCLPADSKSVSYTYDAVTNSGSITVKNVNPKKYTDTLCTGFSVTAAGWDYASTEEYPQILHGFAEANGGQQIDTVGTYRFGYPVTCGQGDIYAAFGPVPDPYGPLNGPADTYPEHFLAWMGFSGPSPTYMQTGNGCNVLDKNYVVPTATAISGCGIHGSISYPTDAATAAKVTYSLRSGNGTSGVNVVRATAIAPWVFPDNTMTKDFTFDLGDYRDCVEPAVTDQVGACTANGVGGADPSTKTVTFTFDNTKSTIPVTFAIASEHISVVVSGGATGQATAAAPEGGASYAVTADSGAGPVALATLVVPSFTGCRTSVAGDPSATPAACVGGVQAPGSITVDAKPGIVYTITDAKGVATVVTQATTPEPAGDYVVTAAAAPGYTLSLDPAVWPYSITVGAPAHCGEAPAPATASSAVSCAVDGTYTLPVDPNVRWQVVRGSSTLTDVAPGTYRAFAQFFDATVTVTALPATGVQFAPGATTAWTFRYAAPSDCLTTFAQLPVTWTHTDAVCTAGGTPLGSITAGTPDEDGYVAYTVDGAAVPAGGTVRVAAGDHILVGTAVQAGDTVDPAGPQTVTVSASSALCPTELKTLALTGVDPTAWIIGGLALLQLGVALVAVHLLRRRRNGRHTA
jgi:hypothetical protein